VKKRLSPYGRARKDGNAILKRSDKNFQSGLQQVTNRAQAVAPHPRIINNGEAMGVKLSVAPFAGQKPRIFLKGLAGMPQDQREAIEVSLQHAAALMVAYGKSQQVSLLAVSLAACMPACEMLESTFPG
jgi:hypothetical protein